MVSHIYVIVESYILEVKKDGTFTLDMEKVGDDYVVKNTQIATDVITITKQWVGGNPNGYIPKIEFILTQRIFLRAIQVKQVMRKFQKSQNQTRDCKIRRRT